MVAEEAVETITVAEEAVETITTTNMVVVVAVEEADININNNNHSKDVVQCKCPVIAVVVVWECGNHQVLPDNPPLLRGLHWLAWLVVWVLRGVVSQCIRDKCPHLSMECSMHLRLSMRSRVCREVSY